MTEKEILLGVASLIDKFGLMKGRYGNDFEGFCILGAFHETIKYLDWSAPDTKIVSSNAIDMLKNDIGDIPEWNDKWYRTKWGVVKRLRKIANKL